MLVVEYRGERIEIWFSPSFNVKCRKKELAQYLRSKTTAVTTYDPMGGWREVSPSSSEWDAFLFFRELKRTGSKVRFIESPTLRSSQIDGERRVE